MNAIKEKKTSTQWWITLGVWLTWHSLNPEQKWAKYVMICDEGISREVSINNRLKPI